MHSHNMRSALSPASAAKAPAREIRPAEWIRRKIVDVLLAAGAHADAADAMASAITEAHLRGVETHGLATVASVSCPYPIGRCRRQGAARNGAARCLADDRRTQRDWALCSGGCGEAVSDAWRRNSALRSRCAQQQSLRICWLLRDV